MTCSFCGQRASSTAKFCQECGRALTRGAEPRALRDPTVQIPRRLAEKIRAGGAALEAEHKQITVLFADVMGSMDLTERVEPEKWRTIMDRFFSILCDGVHRFEGTVDKFTGDGIMALFGAPIAHEDHALRAAYTVLHLQRELAAYSAELRREHNINFAIRMGLNSGEVVVGSIGEDLGMEYTAVGHAVGLAQRMEQMAEPATACLTEHTARLIESHFELKDLGECEIKGSSRPLRIYELVGAGRGRGLADVARNRILSSFVGRSNELGMLDDAFARALGGEGQVIGLVAEAGAGKSRLCHEFAKRQRARGVPIYRVAAQSHTKSVPLLPVLEFLRSYFEIGEGDSRHSVRERISAQLLALDASFAGDLPLVLDFLSVPDPDRPLEQVDPEARQRRLLGFVSRLSRARDAHNPGVTILEDMHWMDAASTAFLTSHVEAVAETRGLTILNFRPGYIPPWSGLLVYHETVLEPLGAQATGDLLGELLGSDPSLAGLPELIGERTKGNPLFIEEFVRSLAETETLHGERGDYRLAGPVLDVAVPASVQALLAARIDRLPKRYKTVLYAAAVIGRQLTAPILQRVTGLDPAQLDDALHALVEGEFFSEPELAVDPLYAFKHPLTQEVAYRTQLARRRAELHGAVARALCDEPSEHLDELAAFIAQNWDAAGEAQEAMRWHARSAEWSGSGDPGAAHEQWGRVRHLADELPDSEEVVGLRLGARISMINLGWRLGMSREDAETLFREAQAIVSAAGDVHSWAVLLSVYGYVKGVCEGDVRGWIKLARESLQMAEQSGDAGLYVGISDNAFALIFGGEFREALGVYDRALEFAGGDPKMGSGLIVSCPYANCFVSRGLVVAHLGELEEGWRTLEEGRKLAQEHVDGEVDFFGILLSSWVAYLRGEPDVALDRARQGVEIGERVGASFSRATAWFILGLAQSMRGAWQAAIDALEHSAAIASANRLGNHDAWRLALLGESLLHVGETQRARELVTRAVEIAHERGAILEEVHANLALARVMMHSGGRSDVGVATAALARAEELARTTGGKAFEPLIHIELAELARLTGDSKGQDSELRAALRLAEEIGAIGWARRASAELGIQPN